MLTALSTLLLAVIVLAAIPLTVTFRIAWPGVVAVVSRSPA